MHGIRETHINWSMVLPETGLEEYWSITGGLSVVSDIGSTQLRHGELGTDPITFDVINKWTRKAGGILRVSTRFSLGVENEQADAARGGSNLSRGDQIFRRKRGQGKNSLLCSADHEQDRQPYPVDSYSAIIVDVMTIHA